MPSRDEILNLIYEAIDDVNPQLEDDQQLAKQEHTALFGKESSLDSMGLVNLIVEVESKIEDSYEVTLSLADEKALSQTRSPFKSVATLVDHVSTLLAAESAAGS